MNVCVFCGANPGASLLHVSTAQDLGKGLAENRFGLVFGAGGAGIMGAVSDGALAAGGGGVIGVIPQPLLDREYGRSDLTDLRIVPNMHERKALMHELSHAFVVLPGGLGTLEEFFEVLTWRQLGLHHKPMIVLNADGYYTPLIDLLDHAVDQGFMTNTDRALVTILDSVPEVLDHLAVHRNDLVAGGPVPNTEPAD